MNLNLDNTPIAEKLENIGLPVYMVDKASHHVYFRSPEDLV